MVKVGIALGRLHPSRHLEAVLEAEKLGFESAWLPEHLVVPVAMQGSPLAGDDHPPVPPTTPVYDAFAYLSFLAGRTERLRLGTHVYLLGLRHPFIAARAVQTLDIVSGGRAEFGIGAGWLESEWHAAGLDPKTRGRRLDEALLVWKRLWTEEVVEHEGEFYSFAPVAFEPKPVQRPWPPILVGGESPAALRRAAHHGNGWIGLAHDPESVKAPLATLRELRLQYETADALFESTVGAEIESDDDWQRWQETGVHRGLVAPWKRSRDAVEGLRRLADRIFA